MTNGIPSCEDQRVSQNKVDCILPSCGSSIHKSWCALVTFFKGHQDKQAKTLLKKLKDYRFLSILHMLMDILPSVAQLSMVLQKQELDVATVKPAISGLLDKIKNVKKGHGHFQSEFGVKV